MDSCLRKPTAPVANDRKPIKVKRSNFSYRADGQLEQKHPTMKSD